MTGRNFDFKERTFCIVGKKGQGKSTLQRELLRSGLWEFIFIFDHKGQFSQLLPAYMATNTTLAEAALEQTKSVCFYPQSFGANHKAGFEAFCKWAWLKGQGIGGFRRKILVADEIGDLVPGNPDKFDLHPFAPFVRVGREWGWDLMVAAQRPTDVPIDLRNQITDWMTFALKSRPSAVPLAQEGIEWEEIQGLQVGEYLHHDGNNLAKKQTRKDQ